MRVCNLVWTALALAACATSQSTNEPPAPATTAAQAAPATPQEAQASSGGESTPGPTPPDAAAPGAETLVGQEVTYSAGDVPLKGYLAYDAALTGKRPGVIVVHEWWGHTEYVRKRADMLAKLGYVALAVDMFGDGKVATHPSEAQQFVQEVTANLATGEARFRAGMELLAAQPQTDPERLAAIGYCFGGAVVLHMARTGMALDGVASFHGNLTSRHTAEPGSIAAKILVMTGEADAMIPPEQVSAFEQEMNTAKAEYRVIRYPGAKHGFTNPEATRLGTELGLPLAYDPEADQASWNELQGFFQALFGKP